MTTTRPVSFRTPRLKHARVSDAMHPGVLSCPAETPLREVAQMLAMHHVHCVVVDDHARRGQAPTWAVMSDLDLVTALINERFEDKTAGEYAAPEPLTVRADDTLQRAVELMAEHQVTHLIVLAPASGRPTGVLSTLDIAGLVAWAEA